jgi:hypothetical protein
MELQEPFKMDNDSEEEVKQEAGSFLIDEETFPKFLEQVGLQTPVDYVFLNYAMIQSCRKIATATTGQLLFLFHLVTNEMLESEKVFPRCAFIERMERDEEKVNVIWTFSPSSEWTTRGLRNFDDFHAYFMNVMKSNYHYSPEELYKVLNEKRGESYFLNHGTRKDSSDGQYHILFVSPNCIVTFHVPQIHIEDVAEKQYFKSKWVSLEEKCLLQDCFEFDVFEFPPVEYLDILEKQKQNSKVSFATPGLDMVGEDDVCETCSA